MLKRINWNQKNPMGPFWEMTILGSKMDFLGTYNWFQWNTINYCGKLDDTMFTGLIFRNHQDENIFYFLKYCFRSQNDHFKAQNGVLGPKIECNWTQSNIEANWMILCSQGQFVIAIKINIFSIFHNTVLGPKMPILGPKMEF